jgi:hypothetical protein
MSTKEPGTAVVTWKERAAMVTAQYAAQEAPKGGFLSFKGGRLSYDDTPIPGDKLNCIIVDFVLENTWYGRKYDPANTSPPKCYALGRDEEILAPHEDSEEPQGGEDGMCATCPRNEWGSDPGGGRGKDCKNTRRIAVIPADVLQADDPVAAIKKASLVQCKLPVTSVKAFSKMINQIVKVLGVPPFGVTVELSVSPSDNMFSVNWKVTDQVHGDEILQALYENNVAAEKVVMMPYPKMEDEAKSDSKKY